MSESAAVNKQECRESAHEFSSVVDGAICACGLYALIATGDDGDRLTLSMRLARNYELTFQDGDISFRWVDAPA